jgi:hypothetical protein
MLARLLKSSMRKWRQSPDQARSRRSIQNKEAPYDTLEVACTAVQQTDSVTWDSDLARGHPRPTRDYAEGSPAHGRPGYGHWPNWRRCRHARRRAFEASAATFWKRRKDRIARLPKHSQPATSGGIHGRAALSPRRHWHQGKWCRVCRTGWFGIRMVHAFRQVSQAA